MIRGLRIIAGVGLMAGVSLLALPEEAVGYATFGQSLPMSQRDFRVYNNFPGANANNNTIQHPNWPGYDGAEAALWKAGAEWNTRPHGDGTGDPLQAQVGSGNANFNYFFNGNASGVGSSNDNIISSLGGSSGGVLAYTETPITNGWRIRYYGSAWNWQDGPSSISSGSDIQGIGCHELGHALGLDHSSISSATMYAYASGSGTGERSLHSDDTNGVRAIYGARNDLVVPRIDDILGSFTPGGVIIIQGENFSATGNRLWLNRSTYDQGYTGGEPLKVSGIASTQGGTQMTVTLPASGWETGGAVHVQTSSSAASSLSESHPAESSGASIDTVSLTLSRYFPQPGTFVDVTIDDYPHPFAPFIVHYANSLNGSIINNQPFQISQPVGQIGVGNLNGLGHRTFTKRVPLGAAGRTVYLEVQVNLGTQTFDSNAVAVFIQ